MSGIGGFWLHEINADSVNAMRDRGVPDFALASVDTVRFCQMIAKIAHGFATAELGLTGFNALAPTQLILRNLGPKENWCGCYRLVGGDLQDYAPDEALHVLSWGLVPKGDQMFLVVTLRLLANLGAPVFHVVVGELSQEQLVRASTPAL